MAHVIYKTGDGPEENSRGIRIATCTVNLANNLFELHVCDNASICPNFISENNLLISGLKNL